MSKGLFQSFDDVWMLDGLRTPMVDYCGAFADANPNPAVPAATAARLPINPKSMRGPYTRRNLRPVALWRR